MTTHLRILGPRPPSSSSSYSCGLPLTDFALVPTLCRRFLSTRTHNPVLSRKEVKTRQESRGAMEMSMTGRKKQFRRSSAVPEVRLIRLRWLGTCRLPAPAVPAQVLSSQLLLVVNHILALDLSRCSSWWLISPINLCRFVHAAHQRFTCTLDRRRLTPCAALGKSMGLLDGTSCSNTLLC